LTLLLKNSSNSLKSSKKENRETTGEPEEAETITLIIGIKTIITTDNNHLLMAKIMINQGLLMMDSIETKEDLIIIQNPVGKVRETVSRIVTTTIKVRTMQITFITMRRW
jgi:hypothetical protein